MLLPPSPLPWSFPTPGLAIFPVPFASSSTQHSQSTSFLAQFITTTTLISLTISRKWMTSAGFRSGIVTCGPIIRSSKDTMNHVFRGKAVNISTGEDCLQNPVASRFGARLLKEKNTGRSRLVLPEANKQHSLPLIELQWLKGTTTGNSSWPHLQHSINWITVHVYLQIYGMSCSYFFYDSQLKLLF